MIDNIWHIHPLNDEKDHVLEAEWKTIEIGYLDFRGHAVHDICQRLLCHCECAPIIKELTNGAVLIIHNSFDGREGIEWVNEFLNK